MRGRTVRENVIIAYRGANYELGQWPQGYGIWVAGMGQSQPNEWWPGTPEGWTAAWYRFVAIEVPGTISQVSPATTSQAVSNSAGQPATPVGQQAATPGGQPAAGPGVQPFRVPEGQPYPAASSQSYRVAGGPPFAAPAGQVHGTPYGQPSAGPASNWQYPRAGAGLLIFGLVCGIIGLFPAYLGGASLASTAENLVPHIIYLAAWAASAVLITLGGTRQRIGALLGLGTSVVTFGLFFADAGTAMAGGAHLVGAGLILGIAGWITCAVGSLLAFGRWPTDWPRKPTGREIAVVVTLIVAALGTAIAFAPSWDSYLLTFSSAPSQSFTAGNAFANPAPVIVGDVAVMVALFVAVLAAAFWRPARLGWALAAGAVIPMAAQAISAFIQTGETTTPSQLGISPSAAAQAGLKIDSGLTTVFWVYLAFVVVLMAACVWLAVSREIPARVARAASYSGFTGPAGSAMPDGSTPPTAFAGPGPSDTAGSPAHGYQPPGSVAAGSSTVTADSPPADPPDSPAT
jgi:hypothetical protein